MGSVTNFIHFLPMQFFENRIKVGTFLRHSVDAGVNLSLSDSCSRPLYNYLTCNKR